MTDESYRKLGEAMADEMRKFYARALERPALQEMVTGKIDPLPRAVAKRLRSREDFDGA